MIRQQAFIHFNEQPFVQEYVDMVYDLAPKVDTAQSSEKDPINERHSDVSWIDPNRKIDKLFQFIYEMVHAANEQARVAFRTFSN